MGIEVYVLYKKCQQKNHQVWKKNTVFHSMFHQPYKVLHSSTEIRKHHHV